MAKDQAKVKWMDLLDILEVVSSEAAGAVEFIPLICGDDNNVSRLVLSIRDVHNVRISSN